MADFDCVSFQIRTGFVAPGAPTPPGAPSGPTVAEPGFSLIVCAEKAGPGFLANIPGPPCAAGPSTWAQFEERLIIWPPVLDVGHVSDTESVSGNIWNTYAIQTATLQAIDVSGAEGIQRTGLPVGSMIPPLQGAEPGYDVTTQGPPIISAAYIYIFDLQDCRQEIVGSRGIVLTSRPLAAGYAEGREWATGIFASDSGKESRRSRYSDFGPPKRFVRMPAATVSVAEQNLLQNALRFGGRFPLIVPLWASLSRLDLDSDGTETIFCDTADREFLAGMIAMVLKASRQAAADADSGFAAREIADVQPDRLVLSSPVSGFLAGDFVLPMIPTATPRNLSLEALDLRRIKGSLEFEELAQPAAAAEIPPAAPQYLGYDIWKVEPLAPSGAEPEAHWEARGETWQPQSAYSPRETGFRLNFRVFHKSRVERRLFREWFDRKRGREGAFWVRSRKPDMELVSPASAGSGLLEIRDALDAFGLRDIPRHVWSLGLGAPFEIGNPVNSPTPGAILLDVNPPLTGDLPAGSHFENFFLVRFADDRMDFDAGGQPRYWRDAGGEDHLVFESSFALLELIKETPTNF